MPIPFCRLMAEIHRKSAKLNREAAEGYRDTARLAQTDWPAYAEQAMAWAAEREEWAIHDDQIAYNYETQESSSSGTRP